MTKRTRQTATTKTKIRKSPTPKQTPKRARAKYLIKGTDLVQCKIDPHVPLNQPMPNDCFVQSLEYLGIITLDMGRYLRSVLRGQGIQKDQALQLLQNLHPNLDIQYQDMNILVSLRHIFELIEHGNGVVLFVSNKIMPNTFFQPLIPIIPQPEGHVIVLIKDLDGAIALVDPQQRIYIVGQPCIHYLVNNYENNYFTFIYKT